MAIETFLVEETEELVHDIEKVDEWHKVVEELGLEGQKGLATPEKSPIPFQRLKQGEVRVYQTLCPNKSKVTQYKNCTIPLRVLSLLALAEKEHYFDGIQIWDDFAAPDPIAVGYKGSEYNGDFYIIARWGDELRAFIELEQMAMRRWIDDKTAELNEKLSSINQTAKKYFKGEWVSI